nr:cobyrinate a,c-diamide synthase [Conexibacter arvalis]
MIGALRARGLRVQGFKVGPDYIDPSYHALASGRPGRNLDAFLSGTELIAPLFRHGAADADVAVIEGVMGLFDGASGRGELASTAQVAKLLWAPVALVVDGSAMARSAAAIVHGFRSFDPELEVAGVIFNRVGSDGHEQLLREAVAPLGVPVLGVLRRDERIAAPERHLGLVPVSEREPRTRAALDVLAASLAERVDLDAVLALARSAPAVPGAAWDPAAAVEGSGGVESAEAAGGGVSGAGSPVGGGGAGAATGGGAGAATGGGAGAATGGGAGAATGGGAGAAAGGGAGAAAGGGAGAAAGGGGGGPARVRIALAAGPAFSFHYRENLELLEAAGAELLPFDPLSDAALPEQSDALVLAGGFPEVYGAELADNAPLRTAVVAHVAAGRPVLAECGGLLFLAEQLDGHEMCGVLPVRAAMSRRLTLGYREATAATATPWLPAGARLRGHEFHYTQVEGTGAEKPPPAWTLSARGQERAEGFVRGAVQASYLHVHWAAFPEVARRFVAAARERRGGRSGEDGR